MPEQHPVDPDTGRRLEAAFTALATREVPDAAPRPAQAPRPSARPPRLTPRRLGIAGGGLLVAAAAVVVAVLIGGEVQQARPTPSVPAGTSGSGTTSPAPASTSPVAPSTPTPSLAEVTAAFAGVSLPMRSDVVGVGSRFQAADLDNGTIRFWIWEGTAWQVVGTSTYPPDAGTDGAFSATITAAAALTGMDVATFLVTGEVFTGDGTGSVIAYTAGPTGWGVIKAGDDGQLHPSGEGFPAIGTTNAANTGLSYGAALVDGLLQTVDCSSAASNAACGDPANQVVKFWRWDGTQFVLDHREGPAS